MLMPHQTNLYRIRLGVATCAAAFLGLWVSLMALIITELSETAFRFVMGFGAVIILLLLGFQSVRREFLESIQMFRKAADDFGNRMR